MALVVVTRVFMGVFMLLLADQQDLFVIIPRNTYENQVNNLRSL